jgi:UDP-N-acetylmuramoyl-L-alanyl-D-glutamate--2,6-diaminopimelate ligase
MRLDALIAGLDHVDVRGRGDIEVRGVACDSRRVEPGDAFFALEGHVTDGSRFVADAMARGAVAIVADRDIGANGVPVVRVRDARAVLGQVAARLAGDPSHDLCVAGVTGTNGKTTTTHLLDGIWRAAGRRSGVIGTVAYRFGAERRVAPFTTPDAPLLQSLLAEMRAARVTHVAMEVSSHALEQQRVAGMSFDAAAFTNLTRDHLDFHHDLDDYFAAKARLFTEVLPASRKRDPVAVVNVDEEPGQRLAALVRARVVRVSRTRPADVQVLDASTTLAGTRATLALGGRRVEIVSPLVGAPHLENVALAAGLAWALGVEPDVIAAGLAATGPPPGRVEQIAGPGFTVVVDYAHTPDALARILEALRPLTSGALVTVFGCGGDRDRGKRPMMGAAAARWSDRVVLTSDNPRTEDPERILADIERGLREAGMALAQDAHGPGYLVEADRRRAIALALEAARPGDVVVVAGKGHEDYQIVGTERRHLDDREEVCRALESRR